LSVPTSREPTGNWSIESVFDAVVMLTWSDWKTEPRSNRYHYASRFAKKLPVYFVQPDGDYGKITFERLNDHNITIVHTHLVDDQSSAALLAAFLNTEGVRRPLLWIYNTNFECYIRRSVALIRIYHATEDYFTEPEGWEVCGKEVRESIMRGLQKVDLVVAVSNGVAHSYRNNGGYKGRIVTLKNGCDTAFWEQSGAASYSPPPDNAKVVLFQGGINRRLDYPLLTNLVKRMPDWHFWFCGHLRFADASWYQFAKEPNVRYFGELSSEGIANLARQSLVGLIPFKQDALIRVSLPLKAYEYIACGLPVVSVPIDDLRDNADLFTFAASDGEFADAIRACAETRSDPALLDIRRRSATAESYDERFQLLEKEISSIVSRRKGSKTRLNVLLIYDDGSTHVGTIKEHIEAFRNYSRHEFFFLPGTGDIDVGKDLGPPDFNVFDAVLIHYSVRVSIEDHMMSTMEQAIARYDGPKFLFAQDEYENTETARKWIERLGVDALFTNVPLDKVRDVYPTSRFPKLDFIPTLTGYVPEDSRLDEFAMPIHDREILIGYRGRKLPHHYGDLGQQKHNIGFDVKRSATERGLRTDIEIDDTHRIYGNDWYRFMGSCRATLGTETGSNVFDYDGSLKANAAKYSDWPYERFASEFLIGEEGNIRMNQISPKIFEAIRLRTALILFEGEYSGVVLPEVHYIPLKKDYSNVDDVFAKLQNLNYVQQLTERAYRDVIGSGKYSYEQFVRGVDSYLDGRTPFRRRANIVSAPIAIMFEDDGSAVPMPTSSLTRLASNTIVTGRTSRSSIETAISTTFSPSRPKFGLPEPATLLISESAAVKIARVFWRLLPSRIRNRILPLVPLSLLSHR
jgi:glycosyltransferase involved in cell wall biosynthesis